ncbi:MAG: NUDIX domain-containing protein [Eubacteriales bacterium]
MAEYWDLYDENRKPTGKTHIRGMQLVQGQYHIVVQAWVYNSRGELLLSRRHPNKHWPLYWECTGGSVTAGEDSVTGIIRELSEEIGIAVSPNELRLIRSVRRKNDFLDEYILKKDCDIGQLSYQPTEVIDAKWVSVTSLRDMFSRGEVIPWLDYIFDYYERYILPDISGTEV